jgi:predicted enzyme related to lactoylglutathione lyase
MNIHYLEIVTNDVEREIKLLEKAQNLIFGEPVAGLGGARTAPAPTGGSIGVRAPMHAAEAPIIRPYFLTDTIAETIDALGQLGAEIAMPPTKIDGLGIFAIYIVGDSHYGLWQL